MADLMPIGRFAQLTGLSTKTLRRYDELGLLTPTIIDLATSYRYYSQEQAPLARRIQQLRALELPFAEIRTLLVAPDTATARAILAGHRAHLATRIAHQQRALTDLRDLDR